MARACALCLAISLGLLFASVGLGYAENPKAPLFPSKLDCVKLQEQYAVLREKVRKEFASCTSAAYRSREKWGANSFMDCGRSHMPNYRSCVSISAKLACVSVEAQRESQLCKRRLQVTKRATFLAKERLLQDDSPSVTAANRTIEAFSSWIDRLNIAQGAFLSLATVADKNAPDTYRTSALVQLIQSANGFRVGNELSKSFTESALKELESVFNLSLKNLEVAVRRFDGVEPRYQIIASPSPGSLDSTIQERGGCSNLRARMDQLQDRAFYLFKNGGGNSEMEAEYHETQSTIRLLLSNLAASGCP